MNFEFLNSVSSFLTSALAIFFAISIHEFGHAFVAHLNGDDTAKNAGRMTINPLSHIDIFGMIMMFVAKFGWAKPVPVNPNNYKNEKVGNITVSLAGIFMNLASAIIFAMIYKYIGIYSLKMVCKSLIVYNIAFASFNILPIPPLDGWSFISTFLPDSVNYKLYEYTRYSFIILILLVMTNVLSFVLSPIYSFFSGIVSMFL
ncbi:MAG: site-2 protease family protein [Peptostreptococcus porci]|nr:site-2 protease family protein [Peptostreptococcus porci]